MRRRGSAEEGPRPCLPAFLSTLLYASHCAKSFTHAVSIQCFIALLHNVDLSSEKQVTPEKLSDDFCVGLVDSCPLPPWGPAGCGCVLKYVFIFCLSVFGGGALHARTSFFFLAQVIPW